MKTDLNLEKVCSNCHGHQKLDNKICEVCNGKGTILTEEGKKILAFLRNSIRMSEH